jgi:murein DD-endopeptidase MepM/ murein hydrolase activator NlpD
MDSVRARRWWVGAFGVLSSAFLLSACASIPFDRTAETGSKPVAITQSDDDDWDQLVAQLRSDLSRYNSREVARKPSIAPNATTARARDKEFADRARALFTPIGSLSLRSPVVGVRARDLSDSWHDPRDGGSRVHKGIDIFAARGTQIVAAADGILSFIGDQPKGGHCLWLTTEAGTSFYYAHLDRWAPGLYEGMEVQAGDLLGFVGNTGNARHTPSHLHFGINQNDEMVNPYPLLARATPTQHARLHVDLGGGSGTR